jgi:phosphoglycolate phosphatase
MIRAMPNPVSAVVFDLDGTLVDSAPDLQAALNETLAPRGFGPLDLATVTGFVGDGIPTLVRRGLGAVGADLTAAQEEQAIADFFAAYRRHPARWSKPYPGVVKELRRLHGLGYPLGVCTNKAVDLSRQVLDELGLGGYFRSLLGGDSLAVRKPDPRTLQAVLDELGVSAREAVMVGDSAHDVETARNAAVRVVVVSYGYSRKPPHQLGADSVIRSFAELPRALIHLGGLPPRAKGRLL